MYNNISLHELINQICIELRKANYTENSIKFYREHYGCLLKLARNRGDLTYTTELGVAFCSDCYYVNNLKRRNKVCLSILRYHNRCIVFIESYLSTGRINCAYRYKLPRENKLCLVFSKALYDFQKQMEKDD